MENRYNPIIVQVYVSFMYGLFIPILFPIALFGILNKYFVEKLTVTYYYRQPPMYNQTLSKRALHILIFAPLLMFAFGYWAFGNQQIFENQNETANSFDDLPNPMHDLFYFKDLNQTHLFLFYLVITFIIKITVDWIIHNVEMDDCDENLGSFWKNIRGIEQKIWYTNEIYQRKKLGIY